MSADLPETDCWNSSMEMARVLASYMDDPQAIRDRILEDFDRAPAHCTIERMRAKHLARETRPQEIHKPCDAHRPIEALESASEASRRFVAALERERRLSVENARRQGALDSPALRQPAIVDRAWDRETETAWLSNGELR